jgi:hypothetical protein
VSHQPDPPSWWTDGSPQRVVPIDVLPATWAQLAPGLTVPPNGDMSSFYHATAQNFDFYHQLTTLQVGVCAVFDTCV